MTIKSLPGSSNNKIKVGRRNELLGDPTLKIEKPYTIIGFPGGDVEISRTSEGNYWVHVAIRDEGQLLDVRLNATHRYCMSSNAALRLEIDRGDVEHIAFLVGPN
jgi:hypothetical protein